MPAGGSAWDQAAPGKVKAKPAKATRNMPVVTRISDLLCFVYGFGAKIVLMLPAYSVSGPVYRAAVRSGTADSRGPQPIRSPWGAADLADFERRAWRYDAQDGILEILSGFLYLIIAGVVAEPRLAWMLALILFPLLFAHRVLKHRYTYPRLGYVKLRSEDGARLGRGMLLYTTVIIAALALGLGVFGDITDLQLWKRCLPALAGAFSAGGFLYLAQRSGLLRHWILAAITAGWGVVCSAWLDAPGLLGIRHWAVGFGAVCLVLGGATFVRFVRTHPVRPAEVSREAD